MVRSVALVALAGWLLVGTAFDAQQPARAVITKHFTPADQTSGRYQYVPFEVPKETGRLRVSYSYEKANGENVVDLGLFEPGPLELGTRAFRGYSGGARAEAVLDGRDATPGYIPGPLPPGQWHALLGLYRIGRQGVDVTLTIETGPLDSIQVVEYEVPQLKAAPSGPGWFKGALHTHTLHSDGTLSPRQLLQLFTAKAFDFIAITDHNNTTHWRELSDLDSMNHRYPLRIIGEEVTTPGGHASVWGLPPGGWVDFRVLPGDPRIRDLVESARRQGAIFSINHPASDCLACGWTHEIAEGIEGIEISNGRHGEVEKTIAIWDKLLTSGRKITGMGSSDWHSAPNPIDNAHVRVHAPSLTQESVLAAIRAGRVIVMTDVDDETPEIAVRAGEITAGIGATLPLESSASVTVQVEASSAARGRLVFVHNGHRGAPVALDAAGVARAEIPASPGYVRFEILRADGSALAYTNPVFLTRQ